MVVPSSMRRATKAAESAVSTPTKCSWTGQGRAGQHTLLDTAEYRVIGDDRVDGPGLGEEKSEPPAHGKTTQAYSWHVVSAPGAHEPVNRVQCHREIEPDENCRIRIVGGGPPIVEIGDEHMKATLGERNAVAFHARMPAVPVMQQDN